MRGDIPSPYGHIPDAGLVMLQPVQQIDIMIRHLKFILFVYAALLIQVAFLPLYLADPFQPHLLIIVVVSLGLQEEGWHGGALAFLLGLLEDSFSGIYLGLSAFSFLAIYLALRQVSGRLYTDSLLLILLVVMLATFANGLMHLLLLLLYSAAAGVYKSLLPALVPQALVNGVAALVVFSLPRLYSREDTR
jgi:rod shape-determining protein MreD